MNCWRFNNEIAAATVSPLCRYRVSQDLLLEVFADWNGNTKGSGWKNRFIAKSSWNEKQKGTCEIINTSQRATWQFMAERFSISLIIPFTTGNYSERDFRSWCLWSGILPPGIGQERPSGWLSKVACGDEQMRNSRDHNPVVVVLLIKGSRVLSIFMALRMVG